MLFISNSLTVTAAQLQEPLLDIDNSGKIDLISTVLEPKSDKTNVHSGNTYFCHFGSRSAFLRSEPFFSEWEHNNINQYATEDIYQI